MKTLLILLIALSSLPLQAHEIRHIPSSRWPWKKTKKHSHETPQPKLTPHCKTCGK